jgi:thymidine kinase
MAGVLNFYYGSMNAGKSLQLLQQAHNFEERYMRPLVLKSSKDTRDGPNVVKSRLGFSRACLNFSETDSLFTMIMDDIKTNGPAACIMIDEAQFLTKDQVFELATLADFHQHVVYTYGLRTDAFGKLFEGSENLLALCDQSIELPSLCFCGAKANMNARCDDLGDVITSGEQLEVGGNERYVSLCRRHWLTAQRNKRLPNNAFLLKLETSEKVELAKAS